MRSIIISDVKKFMGKLLVGSEFDEFLVSEVSISTYNNFNINGRINRDFFSTEELENMSEEEYSDWKSLKPLCYSLIKGYKTPLKFKIVFALSKKATVDKIVESGFNYSSNAVNTFFLNVRYEKDILTCTTGLSLNLFTMDKSLEEFWDNNMQDFVEKKII